MIKQILFLIKKKSSSKFVLKGKCKQCGQCCRNIVFYINEQPIQTEKQFESLKKWKKTYNHFFISRKDMDGALLFTCKSLANNGKCKDYLFRSLACRNYPKINTQFILNGGKPLDNCGFYFDVNKSFSNYLD